MKHITLTTYVGMGLTSTLLLTNSLYAAGNHAGHHMPPANKVQTSNDSPELDCSNPLFANIDVCKGNKLGKMNHGKTAAMDHSKMNHGKTAAMDHSKMGHSMSSIPVSDGSIDAVPMPFPGTMHMVDDPVLTKVMIDRFEIGSKEDSDFPIGLEAGIWIGKDRHKLWLNTEVEAIGSNIEEAELQLLYSRAISPYWDLQAGLRKDFKPKGREWLAIGVSGLAPYYFDIDAALFLGEKGIAGRVSGEYELMLSQKTALIPEAEINFYSKDDPAMGIGSGISDISAGLKLRHEIKRELAPYVGVNWSKKLGKTADFAEEGEDDTNTQIVIGIESWF